MAESVDMGFNDPKIKRLKGGGFEFIRLSDVEWEEEWKRQPPNGLVVVDEETRQIAIYHHITKAGNRRTPIYWIGFDRLTDGAEVLDWIFQVSCKTWATAAHVQDLVKALECVARRVKGVNAQGLWCPCGQNREVSWEKERDVHVSRP